MSLIEFEISVEPTLEPLTIEDVAAACQLGEIPSDQIRNVMDCITAARRLIERRLRRQLCTATLKSYLDGFPVVQVVIDDKLPVKSIASIYYVDSTGTSTLWAATSYQTDYASDQKPCRIMPAYATTWPTVRTDTYKAVTITFTAGYGAPSAVPASIKHAMKLLIAGWYEDRQAFITGTIMAKLPYAVEDCLAADDWGAYS
jgi:uncharacterized phiE125 gp8 family phage protein